MISSSANESIRDNDRVPSPVRRCVIFFFACCIVTLACTWLDLSSSSVEDGDLREQIDRNFSGAGVEEVAGMGGSPIDGEADSPSPLVGRAQIVSEQISNYKQKKALILNVHITHHGGTTLCGYMAKVGQVPNFACMGERGRVVNGLNYTAPWTHNETGTVASLIREEFHMVSWEFGQFPSRPLSDVNWEDSHVVSVIVMRNPIDRSLAGDGKANGMFGSEIERTHENWQKFAKSSFTNNFALSRLTGSKCAQGENTTIACLEEAKKLLKRFTFVLDQACLAEGMAALAAELELPPPQLKAAKQHLSAKERINNTDLYEYMVRRMRRDTELYEWSKGISLVKCPN